MGCGAAYYLVLIRKIAQVAGSFYFQARSSFASMSTASDKAFNQSTLFFTFTFAFIFCLSSLPGKK